MENTFKKVFWLRWIGSVYVDFIVINVVVETVFAIINKRELILYGYIVLPLYFILFKKILKVRTIGEYALKINNVITKENEQMRKKYYVEPIKTSGTYLPWYFDAFAIIELNSALKLTRALDMVPIQLFCGRILEGLPAQLWAAFKFIPAIWFAYCLFRANRYIFYAVSSNIILLIFSIANSSVIFEFMKRYDFLKRQFLGLPFREIPLEFMNLMVTLVFLCYIYMVILIVLLIWKKKIFLNCKNLEGSVISKGN